MTPPESVVAMAIQIALQSPCQKSRRGAVSFVSGTEEMFAGGYNRAPAQTPCDGSEACRASCAKRCLHAEQTCIYGTLLTIDKNGALQVSASEVCAGIDLLHVRLGSEGDLRSDPAPSPSCWQCSREVLALGFRGIWLYEHTQTTFTRECAHCGDTMSWTQPGEEPPRDTCRNGHEWYPVGQKTWNSAWRFWPALEFHEQTLKHCEVYRGPT